MTFFNSCWIHQQCVQLNRPKFNRKPVGCGADLPDPGCCHWSGWTAGWRCQRGSCKPAQTTLCEDRPSPTLWNNIRKLIGTLNSEVVTLQLRQVCVVHLLHPGTPPQSSYSSLTPRSFLLPLKTLKEQERKNTNTQTQMSWSDERRSAGWQHHFMGGYQSFLIKLSSWYTCCKFVLFKKYIFWIMFLF